MAMSRQGPAPTARAQQGPNTYMPPAQGEEGPDWSGSGNVVKSIGKSIGTDLGLIKPDVNVGGQQAELNDLDAQKAAFAQKYNDYQGRAAPMQQQTKLPGAATASGPGQMGAAQASLPTKAVAGQAQATDTAHTTVGPASTYRAASAGPTSTAGAGYVDADNDVRARQLASLDTLQAAANGTAPSAAQEQLRQGLAGNIASQYALMASARGTGAARAQRAAADAVQTADSNANAQAAALRAQEQATARGQLSEAQGAVRGQDIGVSGQNAQLATNVDLANSQAINQAQQAQAQRQQQAASEGAAAQNQLTGQQGNISAAEAAQRAALGTSASTTNAGLQTDVNKLDEQLGEANSEFNSGQTNDLQRFLAGLNTQNNQFNAGQENEMTQNQGQLDYLTGANNQKSSLDVMQLDDQQKRDLLQYLLGTQGQAVSAAQGISKTMQGQSDSQLGQLDKFAQGAASTATGKALLGG